MNFPVDPFSTHLKTEIKMETVPVKSEHSADVANVFIKQEIFIKEHLTIKDETKKESEHDTSSEEEHASSLKNYQTQLRNIMDDVQGNIEDHDSRLELAFLKSKGYCCDVCGKQFGQKGHLNQHNRTIHQGQKDHQCDICSKQFSQKGHLNQHKLTVHQGHKPHQCDQHTLSAHQGKETSPM